MAAKHSLGGKTPMIPNDYALDSRSFHIRLEVRGQEADLSLLDNNETASGVPGAALVFPIFPIRRPTS
jgi:hypothetical protein